MFYFEITKATQRTVTIAIVPIAIATAVDIGFLGP